MHTHILPPICFYKFYLRLLLSADYNKEWSTDDKQWAERARTTKDKQRLFIDFSNSCQFQRLSSKEFHSSPATHHSPRCDLSSC